MKGTHRAINRFREYGRKVSCNNTQTVWILKCDIRKFFANINHTILIGILNKKIHPTVPEIKTRDKKSYLDELRNSWEGLL